MPSRITKPALQAAVDRLNHLTGSPGNFQLEWAYAKVSLRRQHWRRGCAWDVLGCGYVSKGKLFELLHAFIRGVELGKELHSAP